MKPRRNQNDFGGIQCDQTVNILTILNDTSGGFNEIHHEDIQYGEITENFQGILFRLGA